MYSGMQEQEHYERRLKLAEIERSVAAMRSELHRLDGVRQRLLHEMTAAIDSYAASRMMYQRERNESIAPDNRKVGRCA